MADYELVLPWPPSINGYWRAFRGRQIISKKGRQYRKDVISILNQYGVAGELLRGSLSVSVVLNPPTLRRYDVDNFNKGIFDSLTEAKFWEDDEQVIKLTITKGVKTQGGNAIVKIIKVES